MRTPIRTSEHEAARLAYFVTGGAAVRDMTEVRCTHVDAGHAVWTRYSGPIDAPEELPAGSCSSTDYTDWRGDFLVGQTTIKRDVADVPREAA